MDKKHTRKYHIRKRTEADEVRFCLNCNDMDDLALSDEVENLDQLHERFENCSWTGNFDGDICSRIFVAEDRIADADLFTDDNEYLP